MNSSIRTEDITNVKTKIICEIFELSTCNPSMCIYIQSNLAISNSVNSKSPLFRRKIECPWISPSPLRFPGYFEAPLFRTFFHFPWDFEIAGFDCISFSMREFGKILQNNNHTLGLDYFKVCDNILLIFLYPGKF